MGVADQASYLYPRLHKGTKVNKRVAKSVYTLLLLYVVTYASPL
jgi:hypothetical protein